jgi:hypothetical protein
VSDGVPGHGPHFAFIQGVVDGGPIHKTRLRLHDPEILALEPARKVVYDAVPGGIQVSLPDVVVPSCEIKIRENRVMIESIEPSHGVCGDELRGIGIRPNYV